jgi:hypothetical protein
LPLRIRGIAFEIGSQLRFGLAEPVFSRRIRHRLSDWTSAERADHAPPRSTSLHIDFDDAARVQLKLDFGC